MTVPTIDLAASSFALRFSATQFSVGSGRGFSVAGNEGVGDSREGVVDGFEVALGVGTSSVGSAERATDGFASATSTGLGVGFVTCSMEPFAGRFFQTEASLANQFCAWLVATNSNAKGPFGYRPFGVTGV
ncbi:MAG: hypothetical protein LH609_18445 [Rudanella sp.]|nr:hypothetical protein [Rudanella sp.]